MQFDKELELKTLGLVESTASTTGVAFNPVAQREYSCVINVTEVKTSATNETYTLTIAVSDLVGGTYTTIATLAAIQTSGVGKYVVPLNGAIAAIKDPDSAFIRITHTLGGTDPDLIYGAYLTKV